MSNLKITTRAEDDVEIADLEGRITLGDPGRQFREKMNALAAEGRTKIILNLEKVDRIDSSGLGEIVAQYSRMNRLQGTLKLLNVTAQVKDLMVITKLLTVLECFDNEREAVNSFAKIDPSLTTAKLDPGFEQRAAVSVAS